MTTLKLQRAPGETLAAWAWAAVALTPVGWFYGALAAAYSHLGDVVDVNQMITGVLLFVAAPTIAFILAVHAACAGHRAGKIAVTVSGLLLLATILVTLLYGGWIGWPSPRWSRCWFSPGALRQQAAPRPDGAQREEGSPAATAAPGASGRTS